MDSHSKKIKDGDGFAFSSCGDLSEVLMYSGGPLRYDSDETWDEDDCIKWTVLRSKLIKVMYE